MKRSFTFVAVLSLAAVTACSKESTPASASASASASVTAEASVAATASRVAPRLGGSVVAVGEHSVELLVHRSGLVEALVLNSKGEALSTAVSRLVVTPPKPSAEVALQFAAPRARFEGNAGANVDFSAGPLGVLLETAGKVERASLARAVVLNGPELGGSLLVAGDYGAEVFALPTGEITVFLKKASGVTADASAGLVLSANVATAAGATERVALAFDAARRCFSGKASAALAPGAFELQIAANGALSVGRLERLALRAPAVHGGSVVVAGDYSVELVSQAEQIHAFVFDAQGKALANSDVALSLALPSVPKLALDWDAKLGGYRAALPGKLDFEAQPLSLSLVADGRAFGAAVRSLRGVASAKLDGAVNLGASARTEVAAGVQAPAVVLPSGAKLDAKAQLGLPNVGAQLKAGAAQATGAAQAAGAAAKAQLTPPKINVTKSASAGASAKAGTGAGAKASAGFSFGSK